MRIFCELRGIFPSPVGARKSTSNEQNVRSCYMLNHRIRGLLLHHKKKKCYFAIGLYFFGRVFRNILIPTVRMTLEIRYHKNLAKLKRVNNENKWNKPKDEKQKTETKKLQVAPPGLVRAPQHPPMKPRTTGPCDHRTIRREKLSVKVFLSANHTVWTCGGVFIKDTFEKKKG